MRKGLLPFIAATLFASQTLASNVVEKYIPDAERVGEARFTYMLWDVYDATLHAPKGNLDKTKPFTLTLSYLRKLDGNAIAERSAEEIRGQGFKDEVKLAGWYSQMKKIFPDVDKDTKLTGVYIPNGTTRFYKNGQEIGEIRDPEFGKYFFGIWLDEKTSEPQLRRQLLGIN